MTGFARVEAAGAWGTLVCELRSVNHRYLEVSLRLPDSCRAMETELRARLQNGLRRGKVDCTIQHRALGSGGSALQIDEALLGQLLGAAQRVIEQTPGHAHVNAMDVLRWPGVVREDTAALEAVPVAAGALIDAALRELQLARQREGTRLAALIDERCDSLAGLVAEVRARLPEIQQKFRTRLQERLGELGGDLNQERLEQEIVLLMQRLDVAEELDRLTGHIVEARRTLQAPEPAGRRLDFLLQEFNREANTLSSKSQDLETTRAAVEMKVLIEQMREQVQNIE